MYKIYHILSDTFVYSSDSGHIIHPALLFPERFAYAKIAMHRFEYTPYKSIKDKYRIYKTNKQHKCAKIIRKLTEYKENCATYGNIGMRIPKTFEEEYIIIKDNK